MLQAWGRGGRWGGLRAAKREWRDRAGLAGAPDDGGRGGRGMSSGGWARIKEILASALERAPGERARFLDEACGSDARLRSEVESLIEADAESLIPTSSRAGSMPAAEAPPSPHLEPGTRLGRYAVRALLGEGGMGEVYRAHDTSLGRDVAVKVLPRALLDDSRRRERFHREARALATMSHPNVLAIYDTGEFDGAPYLVCELLEGETLREHLARERLGAPRALHYAAEIARGLAAAHDRGIVHRDLKPENVFVSRDSRIKILDFGLAKVTAGEGAPAEKESTVPGTVMGTLGYMAPEQAQGGEADARCDLFALGTILYEMLTRRRAFRRASAAETISAILRDEPLLEPALGVPDAVALVVRRCLEKRPEERFQSARDLAFELDLLASVPAAPRQRPRAESVDPRFLLVLPFANMGADPRVDYLSDGLTETLINNLSQVSGLRVLARATAFRFKDDTADPLAVGLDLGTAHVVTGRVLQVAGRLVIRAELMSTMDGAQVWGQQYDRQQGDVLAIQDEIGREIAAALRVRLSPEEAARLDRRHTREPRAYERYLHGRFFLNKRTAPAFEQAIGFFEEAVREDAGYALAHCGLADASLLLERYGARAPQEVLPRAKAAALRALEIDELLAEAHTSLGEVLFYYEWDPVAMEREFRRAIELNPGYALAHHWLGFNLGELGRIAEALVEIEEALRLDPLSLIINTNRGTIRYFGRQFEAALADLDHALDLDGNFVVAHQWRGRALSQLGRHAEAVVAHRRATELRPDDPESLASYGHACGVGGDRDAAASALDRIEAMAGDRYVSPYWRSVALLGVGDEERALSQLEQACADRCDWLNALGVEPLFDPFRGHPRFQALLGRVRPWVNPV